jgi:DnaJ family protein C protein 7
MLVLTFQFSSEAFRIDPQSPECLTVRGLVLFLNGRLPQALQYASSALRLDPGYDSAMQLRKRVKDVERLKDEGNAAFKSGKLREALEKYGEALSVKPASSLSSLLAHQN